MAFKINKKELLDFEIIHYGDQSRLIASSHRKLTIKEGNIKKEYLMPFSPYDIFGIFRIIRRLLRLDKCNVYPLDDIFSSFLVIRQKKVFVLDLVLGKFIFKFKLKNCRNILQNSICKTPDGKIIFGEYGANNKYDPVPIYISDDNGNSWLEINLFKKDDIRHIHNVSYDKHSDSIWLTTGDDDGQCKLVKCNNNFNDVEILGDGSQMWRTCGIFFEQNYIYWLMDSPNEQPSVIRMNRESKSIKKLYDLEGPVWYIKKLSNGIKIAGVSVEPGSSVKTKSAQLLCSTDYINWYKLMEFEKDSWSMRLFKFGVISFSDGNQSLEDFYISGEALIGLDGKSMNLSFDID